MGLTAKTKSHKANSSVFFTGDVKGAAEKVDVCQCYGTKLFLWFQHWTAFLPSQFGWGEIDSWYEHMTHVHLLFVIGMNAFTPQTDVNMCLSLVNMKVVWLLRSLTLSWQVTFWVYLEQVDFISPFLSTSHTLFTICNPSPAFVNPTGTFW